MSNFNWQTEEEVSWDDLELVANTAVSRRRPWINYLLIVAFVITAVTLIFRQINQRIEASIATLTNDILAVHNLVQQASVDHDVDLFNTLLSGRDANWVDAQSELIRQSNLFDRSALDLIWLPSQGTAITPTDIENGTINLELNPELNAAEMTFTQAYAIAVGNGVTETVHLMQTAVYRAGAQSWLYSPPNDEFWGEYESISGERLSLVYPTRDSEIAQRLIFDLDAKLVEMCRMLSDLNCPDEFHLRVRLGGDSQTLINVTQSTYALEQGTQISLPTPTLVGLPQDESGYQALYRGYAIQLVGAAIAELTDYDCCHQAAYFQALLAYQLADLGLRPFPQDRIDYDRVVQEGITLVDLERSWDSQDDGYFSGQNGWEVVTAVDFLRQKLPEASITFMQQRLSNLWPDFTGWLFRLALETGVLATDSSVAIDPAGDWLDYAFDQYTSYLEPSPIPLPQEDLLLLCSPQPGSSFSEIYQYQLADATGVQHELEQVGETWQALSPLPDKSAILLQDLEEFRTLLWQDGGSRPLFGNEGLTFGQFDPTGQYLLVYGQGQESVSINWADWTACEAGECAAEPLGGSPVWSPLGTDFIMLPADSVNQAPFDMNDRITLFEPHSPSFEWPLFRGNGQPPTTDLDELTRLGSGYSPFWLDETTLGYIRQIPLSSSSNRHELVLMSVTDELPQPILTEKELQLALFDGESSPQLSMRYATLHPERPKQLFVVAAEDDRHLHVFLYNLQTNDLAFLLQTALGDSHSLSFSPDGRYLVITGVKPETMTRPLEEQHNAIYLHDLVTDQSQTIDGAQLVFSPANTYDWSNDGQWLVIAQQNQAVLLVNLHHDYHQFIRHGLGECANVVWLNQ